MADGRTIRELRVDEFDFDLARKDNLVFANRELSEASAHIDAAAADERAAFDAFAQHDAAVADLPGHVASTLEAARYAVAQTTNTYVQELAGSAAARAKIVSDFADSNTLAEQPLVNLTYDSPPSPSPAQNQLPPGVARRLGDGDIYGPPDLPVPKHDQGTPAPGETVTLPTTSPGAPPPGTAAPPAPPAPGEPLPGG